MQGAAEAADGGFTRPIPTRYRLLDPAGQPLAFAAPPSIAKP